MWFLPCMQASDAKRSPDWTSRSNSSMMMDEDVEAGSALLRNPEAPSIGGPLEIALSDENRQYSPSKNKVSNSYLTRHSTERLRLYGLILVVATSIAVPILPIEWSILALVFSSCSFGLIFSLCLSRSVLQCDDGTAEMREVSNPIREGAEGFLSVQYTVRYDRVLHHFNVSLLTHHVSCDTVDHSKVCRTTGYSDCF